MFSSATAPANSRSCLEVGTAPRAALVCIACNFILRSQVSAARYQVRAICIPCPLANLSTCQLVCPPANGPSDQPINYVCDFAAQGRDGSPSRPFADRHAQHDQPNGELGAPRPTHAPSQPSGLRFPFEPRLCSLPTCQLVNRPTNFSRAHLCTFARGFAAVAPLHVRRSPLSPCPLATFGRVLYYNNLL